MGIIRVVIGEPEAHLRRDVRSFLDGVEGFQVVGEASTPEEMLRVSAELSPDVALVGFPLSSAGEIEEVKRLRSLVRDGALILLTRSQAPEHVFNAIMIGAAACISKDTPGEFIASAIRRVAQGEHPIQYTLLGNEELASYVLKWFRETGQRPSVVNSSPCPMSPREVQVLHQVAQGFSNKEIGARLEVSEQTVKNHLTAILRKTATHDRAHAAVLSLQQGWISV
ncbi:MAG: transcriptional regulatory protein degU [Dehalococcoidia bacterium]|nr:transcriptional regulatory protein degU [Dehalococcoidia bacterium]